MALETEENGAYLATDEGGHRQNEKRTAVQDEVSAKHSLENAAKQPICFSE